MCLISTSRHLTSFLWHLLDGTHWAWRCTCRTPNLGFTGAGKGNQSMRMPQFLLCHPPQEYLYFRVPEMKDGNIEAFRLASFSSPLLSKRSAAEKTAFLFQVPRQHPQRYLNNGYWHLNTHSQILPFLVWSWGPAAVRAKRDDFKSLALENSGHSTDAAQLPEDTASITAWKWRYKTLPYRAHRWYAHIFGIFVLHLIIILLTVSSTNLWIILEKKKKKNNLRFEFNAQEQY